MRLESSYTDTDQVFKSPTKNIIADYISLSLTLSLTNLSASAPFSRNCSHRSPDDDHSSAARAADDSRDSANTDADTNLPKSIKKINNNVVSTL